MRSTKKVEKSPVFYFYADDWINSIDRLKLNYSEQGLYILLVCHCWKNYEIEYDYEFLSIMCNISVEEIKVILPKIEHLFEKRKANDGKVYLVSPNMEEQRKMQNEATEKKRKAGQKGASSRWKS